MRVIMTGQIGTRKEKYLETLVDHAKKRGGKIDVFNVGQMMYKEAPDITPKRILDLAPSRLTAVRRSVFKDIITDSSPPDEYPNVVVNTHATFRWRYGLFSGIDFDLTENFKPDMFICLIDDVELVQYRLRAKYEREQAKATLKDCMVWREEEILATELLAQGINRRCKSYILPRGRFGESFETCWRLITKPQMRKVYPSFPMTLVEDIPPIVEDIWRFRVELAKHFIAFDPGNINEKSLLKRAVAADRKGEELLEVEPPIPPGAPGPPRMILVSVREVLDIEDDIDGQIIMRDFKLIDQSDMICAYIPEMPDGRPGISSGVERELQHALEHTKEVYVVWKAKAPPSPFCAKAATEVFSTVDEALDYFKSRGMFAEHEVLSTSA